MAWKHNPAYDSKEYREARRRVLAAAKGCALAYVGICTGRPTEADHRYGLDADPEHRHLQAVCPPCHDVKTAAERRAALAGKPRNPDPEPTPSTVWGDEDPGPRRSGSGPRLGAV